MTQKLCHANCIYSIDGHCRLEYRDTAWKVSCIHYEGHAINAVEKTL